jgi:Holliday junction DNA helicase RuvB
MDEFLDIRGKNLDEKDQEFEVKLRPDEFKDFYGQDKIVENLKIFVQAAQMRNEALDHVLLHGPPGLGKTTLANIIANELKSEIIVTSGPIIEKPGDLAGMLTKLKKGQILFIDEIHRFNKAQQDALLHSIESGVLILMAFHPAGAALINGGDISSR